MHIFFLGILCAIGLCAPVSLLAQSAPIKWGDISAEHLLMDAFPADSNAAVVILADYGDADVKRSGKLVFKRHTRIKILSEAGYEWGTVTIPFMAYEKFQKVKGIKAHTITIGPDGRTQRHKLEKAAIFEEDVDAQLKQIRFTLPALAPGAVIEYQYAIHTENPFLLPNWQFQTTEPTLWSEYRVEFPDLANYAFITYGELPYAVEEREHSNSRGMVRHRWVMQDIPALREEPFMTTPIDYVAALEIQLRSFFGIELLTTWDDVANGLLLTGAFGQYMEPDSLIEAQADAITSGIINLEAKAEAVYDFVRTNMVWDGVHEYTPSRPITEILEAKTGNSADLTMLLIALLRAADLSANPVLVSTRDHGRVIESYPVMSQFNYVLAHLDLLEKDLLLDPTDEERPYTLLPPRALNGRGLLLEEAQSLLRSASGRRTNYRRAKWIDVAATGTFKHGVLLNGSLDDTGTLTTTLQSSDDEYSAFEMRLALSEVEPEELVRDVVLESLTDVELTTHDLVNAEAVAEKLRTQAAFSVPNYAQVAGDFIYFNPTVLDRFEENPLRLPERMFPIDMTYPWDYSYTIRLAIPSDYEVEAMPEDLMFHLLDGVGTFKRAITVQGQTLSMNTRLTLRQDWYPAEQYDELRAFLDQVVSAQAEQVVLKRVTAP